MSFPAATFRRLSRLGESIVHDRSVRQPCGESGLYRRRVIGNSHWQPPLIVLDAELRPKRDRELSFAFGGAEHLENPDLAVAEVRV